jgi:PKD domain
VIRPAAVSAAVVALLALAPAASAAGWLAPADIGPSSSFSRVGMAGDGTAIVAWSDGSGAHLRVRAPGGELLPVQELDGPGALWLDLAVSSEGHAAIAWRNGTTIRMRVRAPDGSLSPPVDLNSNPGNQEPTVAIDSQGDVTVVWRRTVSMSNSLLTRTLSAAGELSLPQQISETGVDSDNPDLALDDDGDALFAWRTSAGPRARLRSAADGQLNPAGPIDLGVGYSAPVVTSDADGDAVVGWKDGFAFLARGLSAAGVPTPTTHTIAPLTGAIDVAGTRDGFVRFAWGLQMPPDPVRVQTRTLLTDGTLTPVVDLTPSDQSAFNNVIAVGEGRDALVGWTRQGSPDAAEAVVVDRTGALSPFGSVVDPVGDSRVEDVAVDPAGHGVLLTETTGGGTRALLWDPVAPRIDAVTAPDRVERADSAAFSVSGADVGGTPTAGWAFGDGGSAAGASVTHSFQRTGSFEVTVTLTDPVGNAARATRTVVVRDTRAPRFLGASMSRKRFRVARGRTRISARRGSAFRFRLSESARVRIAIQRRKGRRFRRVGRTLARRAKQGANRVKFTGRIGRKALKPGRYRARLTATDPAGNRSKTRTLRFRIVRR